MQEIDTLGLDDVTADILISSYHTLSNIASSVSLIEDKTTLSEIYDDLFPFFINASSLTITLKNVFAVKVNNSTFHVAHVAIDHDISGGRHQGHGTDYCLLGIAKIDSDKYGEIYLEPRDETISHFVTHINAFFNRKHNLDNSLSGRYSIWAADISRATSFFSTDMIHAIAASNNLKFGLSGNFLRMGFARRIEDDQILHLFDILSKATKC